MAHLVYFSDARINLESEIRHQEHAALHELLAKHAGPEFELKLAETAAYCQVMLDGTYTQMELDKLCEILTKRLIEKRTGFVLSL